MIESFWTIPEVTSIRTPLSILREQAVALTEQTKGTLVGMVDVQSLKGAEFLVVLDVSVPALNNYHYRVLSYRQPIEMYPGCLYVGDDGQDIADERAFVGRVKHALSSEKVKNILLSLLSQAMTA